MSLSCGGSSYTAAYNISWVSDNGYIETGNTSTVTYIDGNSTFSVPIRFFPDSHDRQCYKVPVTKKDLSSVLIRATFIYRNYDSQNSPPAFHVSLGRRITSTVDLRTNDPWIEELVWSVNNDSLLLCLLAIKGRGIPVISSLEVRPLPLGAYKNSLEGSSNIILRRSYRINSGYTNGTIR